MRRITEIGGVAVVEGATKPRRMRPLRITMLLENNVYPRDPRVRDEAEALTRAGHSVRVISPRLNGQPAREVVNGVEVERFRLTFLHSGSLQRLVIEYLVAHAQLYWRGLRALLRGTDVLHAHNPPDTMFPLGLVARALGRKFVFDQHDLFPELVTEKYSNRFFATLARGARRLSLRAANLVITANDSQRAAVLGDHRSRGKKVVTVRNGLTRAWLERKMTYRSGALHDPSLLYLGVLESQDGGDALPTILSMLIENHGLSDVHLSVVGTGSRWAALKQAVEERGLGNHVTFTGAVLHEQALAAIVEADICLDVAPCTEFNHQTTMVKIIEYLTLRKPVVSFPLTETMRLGGDAIAYARCNDLASFADRVAELAKSEQLRMELVRRSERVARDLVWEQSAASLVGGYQYLVDGSVP